MTQPAKYDQLTALIECNNDLRRELDAANKLIKELYEENNAWVHGAARKKL